MAVQKPGLLDSDHVLTAADFNVCWNDVNTVTPQLGEIKQEVHSCGYCHGKTTNDYRGNCAACGGPRMEVDKPIFFIGDGDEEEEEGLVLGQSRWGSILGYWRDESPIGEEENMMTGEKRLVYASDYKRV